MCEREAQSEREGRETEKERKRDERVCFQLDLRLVVGRLEGDALVAVHLLQEEGQRCQRGGGCQGSNVIAALPWHYEAAGGKGGQLLVNPPTPHPPPTPFPSGVWAPPRRPWPSSGPSPAHERPLQRAHAFARTAHARSRWLAWAVGALAGVGKQTPSSPLRAGARANQELLRVLLVFLGLGDLRLRGEGRLRQDARGSGARAQPWYGAPSAPALPPHCSPRLSESPRTPPDNSEKFVNCLPPAEGAGGGASTPRRRPPRRRGLCGASCSRP